MLKGQKKVTLAIYKEQIGQLIIFVVPYVSKVPLYKVFCYNVYGSLVPMQANPTFQCCTLKSWKVWGQGCMEEQILYQMNVLIIHT